MNPLDTRPKTVAIVGLGPSVRDYMAERFRKKHLNHVDEVWMINTGYRAFNADKIFIMDDLRNGIAHNYPDWSNELKTVTTPIITCRQYDEYPSSVAYPLEAVVKSFNSDYFSVTPAYMVALAMLMKVETVYLYGIDFHYPNAVIVERGAGCVSYWLGRAEEHGVRYKIPAASTLLDANIIEENTEGGAKRLLYGYDYNPQDAKRRVENGDQDPSTVAIAQNSYSAVDTPQEEADRQ
jgi:hypothetical protein